VTTPAGPPHGDGDAEREADGDAAPEAASEPAPEPTPEPDAEPASEPVPDSAAEPIPQPEAASEADPAAEPADTAEAAAANAEAPAPEDPAPGDPAERPAELGAPKKPRRRHRGLRIAAICTAVVVLIGGGGLWYVYEQLNGNITTDTATETQLKVHESERPTEGPTKAENVLLIGSDNRGSGNEQYGHDTGTQRSDTTILLHLSADRSSVTAMSIPRDLMTHVPECQAPDGHTVKATFEQFNWAFQFGGAACTIRTVENMTHIRIDHHLIVDFAGFKKMVNAIGGVDVCLKEPVHDIDAQLDLPAGKQKLNGAQALGFVRARESIGDGSDTQRMERQQDFLASLIKKVRSNGVLLNPVKLYPLLSAATSSLTADPGLDSLNELYDLVHSLQKTPTGAVHFLTVPQEPYVNDHNRDQLIQPDADGLFTTLREDRPVAVAPDSSSGDSGATPSPDASGSSTASPSTAPTYHGTTADRDICDKN
jgi:LCP family protein required for cell wall assembly